MRFLAKPLITGALLAASLAAFGSVAFAQETDDPVKIQMYQKFRDNYQKNPGLAYQAARDYLAKYTKDKDQYTDYLAKWMAAYERDERKLNLPGLINEKKFDDAYKTGAKILADEPDYLRAQIDLGYAGYLAASAKNETHTAEALAYATKAIQLIESGKTPSEWAPFKGKDDTLAYLNYAVGYMNLKTDPTKSIDYLLKAASYESEIKKTPSTYYFLAVAYESGAYKTAAAAYQKEFADKPETPASKAALEKLSVLMDRIIDGYARAIATSGTDPKTEQSRKDWMVPLSNYYKFRHGGSDTGMTEYINGVLKTPLPAKP